MSAAAATHMALPAHAVVQSIPVSASVPVPPPTSAPTPPAASTLSLPLGKRGHKRSVSLENNAPLALRSTPNLGQSALGSPLLQYPHATGQHFIPHTGTLKSRQEQRRLSQKFGSHSNLDDDGVAVGVGGGLGAASQLRSKFQNIRQMFELSRSCVGEDRKMTAAVAAEEALQSLPATLSQRRTTPIAGGAAIAAGNNGGVGGGGGGGSGSRLAINEPTLMGESMEQIQGNGNFLRPIAFKPIPFEPDYRIQQQQQQHHQQQQHQQQQLQQQQQQQQMHQQPPNVTGQGERYGYGSTPSLVPLPTAATQKFGSTTDLRHLAARRRNHRVIQRSAHEEGLNLDCLSVPHDANSKSSTAVNSSDLTPSPSDSGISELEAALKDRDSELSYLRQAMEHNEKVIFQVQKDKEIYWEHETQRIKLFYEGQQREYQLKFKKMEQLLALQQFQLKQHKLRQSEQVQKLQQQLEHARSNNQSLQNSNLTLNQQLEEAHQAVANLRTQLEDSEWKVCERNGEIALLKTQLKEAHLDIHLKDHAIVTLKHSNNNNSNINNNNNNNNNNNSNKCDTSLCQSQPKEEPLQQQQLHKIIGLKDQVISALTNELAKLRKELSDLAIAHEYGEEPCGRYTRLKQQLDNLNEICQKTRKYSTVPNIEKDQDNEEDNEELTTPQQQTLDTLIEESTTYAGDIAKLRQKLDDFRINLELEKRQWCAEKDKVLGYQKQLQAHYIHMYQKLRCLDNNGIDSTSGTVNVKSTNVN